MVVGLLLVIAYRTLQAITGCTVLHGIYSSRVHMRICCSVEHCTDVVDCSAEWSIGTLGYEFYL